MEVSSGVLSDCVVSFFIVQIAESVEESMSLLACDVSVAEDGDWMENFTSPKNIASCPRTFLPFSQLFLPPLFAFFLPPAVLL